MLINTYILTIFQVELEVSFRDVVVLGEHLLRHLNRTMLE